MQNYSYPYQPYQMQSQIAGRIVDDYLMVNANDIPMDGNIAVFPKRDLSEIQIRRWMPNGQITMTSYKPYTDDLSNNVVNVSPKAEESQIDSLKSLIEGMNEKVDQLSEQISKRSKTQ